MWNSYNILTFTILRHFRTVPMGTVCILWFFLVLRNFWVGTVKKHPVALVLILVSFYMCTQDGRQHSWNRIIGSCAIQDEDDDAEVHAGKRQKLSQMER